MIPHVILIIMKIKVVKLNHLFGRIGIQPLVTKALFVRHIYYIDYNRFKYARVEKIASPQDVWAIDFWFYTSTCHGLVKRSGNYNWSSTSRSDNNNNFKEFTLEWNYHIKIRVHAEKKDDDPSNAIYNYFVDCKKS